MHPSFYIALFVVMGQRWGRQQGRRKMLQAEEEEEQILPHVRNALAIRTDSGNVFGKDTSA
jgi:hypothetical protein